MSGVVSPPLLATTGIVPCSIFSTGPDIIEHYCDCIIAAKREVILLTNYWQGGKNVDRIADALRELNRRVKKRIAEGKTKEKQHGGTENGVPAHNAPALDNVVVKLMWDRGPQTLADLFRCRKPVPPSMWKSNGLPTEDEVPHLSVEILNYHRPLMGTFHAKLLLVDRQVALINSNNIQDRPNVEACVRFEGDIVNSIYDHALISWGNRLNPPLPCLGNPASKNPSPTAFIQGDEGHLPSMSAEKLRQLATVARRKLQQEDEETEDEKYSGLFPGGQGSAGRRLSFADVVEGVMKQSHDFRGSNLPRRGSADAAAGDDKGAARQAASLWAQKVLGDRRNPPPGLNGSPDQTQSSRPSGKSETGEGSGATGDAEHQPRRHLVDVVEQITGRGPSSSKNVEDEVRKSREQRKKEGAAQATHTLTKGVHVPRAVPEDGVDDSARSNTVVDDQDFPGSSKGRNEGSAHQPSGPRLRSDAEDQAANQGRDDQPVKFEDKDIVEDGTEGAPGSIGYRTKSRTLSNASRTPASARLAQITKSLDFANLSQVKGEIKADELDRHSQAPRDKSPKAAQQDPIANGDAAGSGPAHDTAASTPAADGATADAEKGADLGLEHTATQDAALRAFAQGTSDILDFRPYTFHAPHKPVPMALVNRRPHGTPGHSDIRNPQDAAWLAGFRYAQKHIFVQSPTLNATPIKAAVLAAARRHVRVELWLDLGFNDKSESMPFQGGTNEQVVTSLYRTLRNEGKGDEKYLEVFWYTGKDMTRPLNAVRKQRNCHVKYAAFDGQVAILGSGNQDTQSWFHSQEINVMVDSRQIVGEWDMALRRNQSTGIYGRVDSDGIWRGRTGSEKADDGKDGQEKGAKGAK